MFTRLRSTFPAAYRCLHYRHSLRVICKPFNVCPNKRMSFSTRSTRQLSIGHKSPLKKKPCGQRNAMKKSSVIISTPATPSWPALGASSASTSTYCWSLRDKASTVSQHPLKPPYWAEYRQMFFSCRTAHQTPCPTQMTTAFRYRSVTARYAKLKCCMIDCLTCLSVTPT